MNIDDFADGVVRELMARDPLSSYNEDIRRLNRKRDDNLRKLFGGDLESEFPLKWLPQVGNRVRLLKFGELNDYLQKCYENLSNLRNSFFDKMGGKEGIIIFYDPETESGTVSFDDDLGSGWGFNKDWVVCIEN